MQLSLCLLSALSTTICAVQGSDTVISLAAVKQGGTSPGPRYVSRKRQSQVFSEFEESNDFWFAHGFNIGDASNLTLLIDTGSSDLLLNKGAYKPSSSSRAYSKVPTFNVTYGSATTTGTGTETVLGDVFTDVVGLGKFSMPNQVFGVVHNFSLARQVAFPGGDGIIGFSTTQDSYLLATPWFYNLCHAKAFSQCRFGMAFGTDKHGVQVLGGVNDTLYEGALTTVPTHPEFGLTWAVYGDLSVNSHITLPQQVIVMDSGTANIIGTAPVVKDLFTTLGLQIVNYSIPLYGSLIKGYFPCDKPPQMPVGFSFPAQKELQHSPENTTVSKQAKTFNILPSQWAFEDNGNNNCTAVIIGLGPGEGWVVGQPFFEGHYLDFFPGKNYTFGIADLKSPANGREFS